MSWCFRDIAAASVSGSSKVVSETNTSMAERSLRLFFLGAEVASLVPESVIAIDPIVATIDATVRAMLAVSVFAAATKAAEVEATVVVILAEIVFAVEARASKRDLARVRKKIRDKFVRNRCKIV